MSTETKPDNDANTSTGGQPTTIEYAIQLLILIAVGLLAFTCF